MSSTTIRYSGVPENSHSRDTVSDLSADSAAYTDITTRFRAAIDPGVPDPDVPNPNVPGAYRYRTDPDSCDPSAPPSDPRSPHYEPPHLRHRPGDTYLIDRDRPRDPLDPGPFGTPGWFPDRRTGRHRRDELPDSPTRDEIEEDPDMREWADNAEALLERRTHNSRRPHPKPGPGGSAHAADEPAPPSRTNRPRPGARVEPEAEAPYRFSKIRELAWERFLDKSELLAEAHTARRITHLDAIEPKRAPLVRRLVDQLKRMASVVKGAGPEPSLPAPQDSPPPTSRASAPGSQLAQAIRGVQAGRAAAAQARPSGSGYAEEWERQFESRRVFAGLTVLSGGGVAGGAACV